MNLNNSSSMASASVSVLHEDDDLSESSIGDNTGTHTGDTPADSSTDQFREVRNMTRKETKDVETWRDLVTGVMVITGCFVTTACFIYLSRDETDTFKLAVRLPLITE